MRNDTPYNIQQWNTTLQKYIQEGNIPEHISTLVHHVVPIKILNLQDQLYFLSSISNYHWWKFIRCDGNKSKSGIHVRLTDHLLYHPISEQSPEELTLKYIPESPRNRLMYYLHKENIYPGCLKLTIAELLKLDISQQNVFQNDHSVNEQPSKRRKIATRVLKVTPEKLCDTNEINFSCVKNSIDPNKNLYTRFSQQLITDGTIQWRKHNLHEDIVLMSDYNPTNGLLLPLSYAHITCTTDAIDSETVFIKCTCHIYNTIQCAGLSGTDLSQGEDIVLDQSMTCMHCRFFWDYLLKYRNKLKDTNSSTIIDTKVNKSLATINNPVVLLGAASPHSTTKLSVVHESTVAMIHINFNQSNSCFAKCQNGECSARLQNKKKIPKVINIQESQNFCGHIQTLLANIEILNEMFPEYFTSSSPIEEDDEDMNEITSVSSDVNIDDEIVHSVFHEEKSHFDVENETWIFASRSSHKPKEMTDLELTKFVDSNFLTYYLSN